MPWAPLLIKYGQQPSRTSGDQNRVCLILRAGADTVPLPPGVSPGGQACARKSMARTNPVPVCGCRLSNPAICRRPAAASMTRCSFRDAGLQGFLSRTSYEVRTEAAAPHPYRPGRPWAQGQGRGGVRTRLQPPTQDLCFSLPLTPTTVTQGILSPFYRRQEQGSE